MLRHRPSILENQKTIQQSQSKQWGNPNSQGKLTDSTSVAIAPKSTSDNTNIALNSNSTHTPTANSDKATYASISASSSTNPSSSSNSNSNNNYDITLNTTGRSHNTVRNNNTTSTNFDINQNRNSIIVRGVKSTIQMESNNKNLKSLIVNQYKLVEESVWDKAKIIWFGISRKEDFNKYNNRFSVVKVTFQDSNPVQDIIQSKRRLMSQLQEDQIFISEFLSKEQLELRKAHSKSRFLHKQQTLSELKSKNYYEALKDPTEKDITDDTNNYRDKSTSSERNRGDPPDGLTEVNKSRRGSRYY